MFEKEIEELFKLSMRVANETPAFVEFDVRLMFTFVISISWMQDGIVKQNMMEIIAFTLMANVQKILRKTMKLQKHIC